MSKYKRNDEKFREQLAALANAGFKFPTAAAKLPEYTLQFDEYDIAPKAKLSEFVAGIIYGAVVGGAIVGLVVLIVGGVR